MKPRTSLARRALLLLGIQALLLLVVIGSAFVQLRRVEEAQTLRLAEDSRTLLTCPRLTAVLHDASRLANLRLLPIPPDEAARVDVDFGALPARFATELAALRAAVPEYSRSLSELDAAFRVLLRIAEDSRNAARQRQFPRAHQLLREQFQPRWQQLANYLATLADRTRLDLQRRAAETGALTRPIIRRTMVGALLILAASLLAAYVWVWRTIAEPLRTLGRASDRLAAGDTAASIPHADRTDELGALASSLGTLAQRLTQRAAPAPAPAPAPHARILPSPPATAAPPAEECECCDLGACAEPELRSLVEAAPDAMILVDASQEIAFVNRQAERLFGYDRSELMGQPSSLLVPARLHAEHVTNLARLGALAKKLPGAVVEGVGLRRDGSEFPIELAVAPIESSHEDGLLCASIRDISDHRRIEAELADKVAFQRALIDTIPYPVFIKDAEARFLGCNSAYERTFRTTSDDIRGRTVLEVDYLPADDRTRFHAEDLETLRTRERRSTELSMPYADGQSHVSLYTVDALLLDDGRCGGLIGILVDITDRKEMEEELRRQQRLLQNLIDNAEAYVFVKDLEGRYLLVNQRYVQLLNRPASEILGRTMYDLFPKEAATAFQRDETSIRDSGRAAVNEVIVDFNGQPHTFLVHKFPLFDSDGRMFGLGGISTDISPMKESQRELARARDDAEAANRAKSAFVATMSHEIRTPMNAIINLTALALDSQLTPRQRQYVSVAHSSARGLLALLNDILDFSKIEAGRLELENAPFHLRALLEEVADSFRGRVLETRIEFGVLVADDVPDALLGDTLRLRQVLTNLLGNAFKFTERGQIVVRVALLGPAPDPGTDPTRQVTLRFSVADTGIGIPPEKRARLFEAFSQADSSTSRKYGGTGLGLVISQRLVRLMQGELDVTSEAGRGSEFHFTARFAPALDLPPAPGGLPMLQRDLLHTRALVIEDSDLSRELLVTMLHRFGMVAEGVATAEAGLARLRAGTDSSAFGLVVLDWLLPDINGTELARRIRALPGFSALPLVMVSAYATEQEEAAAREAGVQAFVPKPITGSLLLDAITRATGLRPEASGAASRTETRATLLAGRRLLVAEDNDANQFVVRELLQREGATVEIVENGAEAVEMARGGTFDLVLMDMQMPVMDGLEATRRIRALGPVGALPIVALTANAMKSDLDACLAAGMNDYVAKPIDRASLLSVLTRNLAQAAAPASAVTVPSAPEPARNPTPETAVSPAASETPLAALTTPAEAVAGESALEVARVALKPADVPSEIGAATAAVAPATEPAPAPASPVPQDAPADAAAGKEAATAPRPRPARRKRAAREMQLNLLETPEPSPEEGLRERIAAGKLPGIDVEDAMQRLGLPREVIESMVLQFATGQRELVPRLRAAVARADAEESRRLAHSLAGSAGNLSMHELRRLAKTVELAIKFQQGDLSAMLEDLEREATRVLTGLALLAELRATPAPATRADPPNQPAATVVPDRQRGAVGPAVVRALHQLAEGLDNGDLDAIGAHFRDVEAALGESHGAELRQVRELVDGFEHAEAARVVRFVADSLTRSPSDPR